MTDEVKLESPEEKGAWQKTKDWVSNNRVVTGVLAGGAAGAVLVPGLGVIPGALVGGVTGWWSKKEARAKVYGLLGK